MLLMAMALLLFNMRCAAATGVWTNLLGGSWATAANWSHNVIADGVDSTADFNKLNITTDRKVHLDTARTNGNLVFGDTNTGTAAGWTLDNNGGSTNILTLAVSSGSPTITVNALGTGKAATISAGLAGTNGLTKAGAGTLVLPNATTYTGGTMISNGTLLYNLSGMVNGSSLQTNTVGSSGTLTFSNVNAGVDLMLLANTVLTGAGTITKIGAGYVDLWTGSSISGFTGSINVQAGTLAINGAEANAPQMTLNIATGAAFDDRNVSSVVINQLTGSGTLTKSYSGSSPATVSVGNNNGSSTFSGVIQNPSGTVALTKNGTGTFVLGGASTYAGATTVGGGILLVNGSIGTGAVTVKANATLGGTGTINGPVTVQSAGTLAVGTTNLGTLTLASPVALNSGSTNFLRLTKTGGSSTNDVLMTGTLTYGGTLVVTNATGDTNTLAAGDTFKLFPGGSYSGAFTTSNLPPLSGGLRWDTSQLGVGGTIAVVSTNAAAAPLFNPVAGGYIGAQTVTISSLTPGATIYYTTNGTTPTTGSPNAPSGLTITVPVSTTMTIRAFTSAPGYTVSTVARATYATGTNGVWANRAGGSWTDASNWTNNIIASGAGIHADFSQLLLNSAVTVTLDGALTIGNLVFGDGGNTFGWTLNPGSGGSLTQTGSNTPGITVNTQPVTINAVVTGTNGLNKLGAGTLTLSAPNTYSGGTLVSNGGLLVNGSIASGLVTVVPGATLGGGGLVNSSVVSSGAVAPGTSSTAAGRLRLAQNYTQNSDGILNIGLAGPTAPGTDYDNLTVAGAANLGGTLNVTLLNGYAPTDGDALSSLTNTVFTIVSAGTVKGAFTALNPPSPGPGLGWELKYSSHSVLLSLSQIAISCGMPVAGQVVTVAVSPDLLDQGMVTVTNSSHGISEQLVFNAEGKAQWTPTQYGKYILSCGGVSLPVWVTVRPMTFHWWSATPAQTNVTVVMDNDPAWSARGITTVHWAGGGAYWVNDPSHTGTNTQPQDWTNMWSQVVDGGIAIDELYCEGYPGADLVVQACGPMRQAHGSNYSISLWDAGFGTNFYATAAILKSNNVTMLIEDYYGTWQLHTQRWASARSYGLQDQTLSGIWPGNNPLTNAAAVRADVALVRLAAPEANGIAIFAPATNLLNACDQAIEDYFLRPVICLSVTNTQLNAWNLGNEDATGFSLQFKSSSGAVLQTVDLSGLTANSQWLLSIPTGTVTVNVINPAGTANLYWNTTNSINYWNGTTNSSGTIKVVAGVAAPIFTPPAGRYAGAQTVTISCSTPGATIYYTTNGTTPTTGSLSGASGVSIIVPVNTTMTIQAYATAPGYAASALASGYYSITTVPPGFTGITALYGGVMQFSGTGGVVQAYVLSGTTNLAPASWMPIVTNIADTNGMVIFTDSQATNYGQRYYRLSTP